MADILIKADENLLPNLARSIMNKTGKYEPLTLAQFQEEVESINVSSGGNQMFDKNYKLLYELPQQTTFNGVDDYIDTGVKLLEEEQDFTILIDAVNGTGNQSLTTIFHCVNESNPYPGVSMLGSDYTSYSDVYAVAFYDEAYSTAVPFNNSSFRAVLRREKGGKINILAYNNGYLDIADIKNTTATWVSVPQTLLLGCYQTTSGSRGRFWNGTMNDFKVYNRYISTEEADNYLKTGSLDVVKNTVLPEKVVYYNNMNGYEYSTINAIKNRYSNGYKVCSDFDIKFGYRNSCLSAELNTADTEKAKEIVFQKSGGTGIDVDNGFNGTDGFTIGGWFNKTMTSSTYERAIFFNCSGALGLYVRGGTNSYLDLDAIDGAHQNIYAIKTNTWYHFAISFVPSGDTLTMKLYIDGMLIGTYTATKAMNFSTISIGSSSAYGWLGLTKNIFISRGELTNDEISYMMSQD